MAKRASRKRILFVCSGNTCRSPMAQQIFKNFLRKNKLGRRFEVLSAGIFAQDGDRMTENAAAALKYIGIKPALHKAVQLSDELVKNSAFVVCMTADHKRRLSEYVSGRYFTVAEITGGAEVPDPYGHGADRYVAAAEYLAYACGDILKKILEEL